MRNCERVRKPPLAIYKEELFIEWKCVCLCWSKHSSFFFHVLQAEVLYKDWHVAFGSYSNWNTFFPPPRWLHMYAQFTAKWLKTNTTHSLFWFDRVANEELSKTKFLAVLCRILQAMLQRPKQALTPCDESPCTIVLQCSCICDRCRIRSFAVIVSESDTVAVAR